MRIGLVGAGGMGTVHHSNYAHIDGCQVVAVVGLSDKDKENAGKWGLPLYADVPAMVAAEKPDLVDVCTPTFLHRQHVTQALKAGVHTLVEKPVALSAADAAAMYALADEKGVQLYVGQVLQFSKEVEVLRGLVTSGEYGKPLDAVFERLSACPRWAQGGWLFDKSKSGLLPYDLHIHDLDIIVSLFGRPKDFSYTSCGGADKPYKEQYRFTYRYEGLNVCAEAAWFNADLPFIARWRVYFERAVVVNDGQSVTAYAFNSEPRVFNTEEAVKIPTGINVPPTGIYYEELKHFTACATRGEASGKVPRSQVMAVMELLEAVSQGG